MMNWKNKRKIYPQKKRSRNLEQADQTPVEPERQEEVRSERMERRDECRRLWAFVSE